MVPLHRRRFLVVHLYSSLSINPLDFSKGKIYTKNCYFWRFWPYLAAVSPHPSAFYCTLNTHYRIVSYSIDYCHSNHATYCVIIAGASHVSKGNKNVGCGTWKLRFFALAVRITGKLFKVYGYMLRGVWQALNCLFIHATFCVIAAGASPGKQKKWRPGYVKMTIFFAIVVRITGKLL